MNGNSRTNPTAPAVAARQATGATFQINIAKIFVTVAILSINNNIKFWENIKQRFKRTSSWKKNISEIRTSKKQ